MAQCKKINPDGKRCGNRAVPGKEFCAEHRERILFTPKGKLSAPAEVSPPAPPSPLSPPEETPAKPAAEDPVETLAQPAAGSGAPAFPHLRRDSRNVLIGPEAIIEVPVAKLIPVLCGLSGELDLANYTTLRICQKRKTALVCLKPGDVDPASLARVYEHVASQARLCEGEAYVGAGSEFVRYRDQAAPFGYDAKGVEPAAANQTLRLLGPAGWQVFDLASVEELDLRKTILGAVPTPQSAGELPEKIFVLASGELHRLFAGYFRSHHFRYRLARVELGNARTGILFEVSALRPVAGKAAIPRFVAAFIRSLPQAVLLQEVFREGERQVLMESGCALSWSWEHVAGVLPEHCLAVFTCNRIFPNFCFEPQPALIDGDTLLTINTARLEPRDIKHVDLPEPPPIRVELRFDRDTGTPAPTLALLLNDIELRWLGRLLYHLPESVFSQFKLCCASPCNILLSENGPIQNLPLGTAMKPVLDSDLYIPRQLRLIPNLPLKVLSQALNLKPNHQTFLTPQLRLDVPADAFQPLSRLLFSELNGQDVQLKLLAPRRLPDLKWKLPEGIEETSRPEFLPARAVGNPGGEAIQPADLMTVLRSQAEKLRASGDVLGAALYQLLAGNPASAADFFREQGKSVLPLTGPTDPRNRE